MVTRDTRFFFRKKVKGVSCIYVRVFVPTCGVFFVQKKDGQRHHINQPATENQPTNKSTVRPTDQPINQQSIYQSANQNQPTNRQPINRSTYVREDGGTLQRA